MGTVPEGSPVVGRINFKSAMVNVIKKLKETICKKIKGKYENDVSPSRGYR